MLTALLVIAILVLLIVAHELGHFVAAKIFGVKVEEFGIGYPPRAFILGRYGGTEYTLNWIPFGGFVRLFGDAGERQHGRGSFVDANRAVQATILVAGVVANVVAAWMLFTVALHLGVPQSVVVATEGQAVRLLVSDIVPGSPADVAGIKPGDQITDVVGSEGERLGSLTPSEVVDFVKVRGGDPVAVTYLHAGKSVTVEIIPANAVIPHAAGQPALGIALALVANTSLPWNEAAVVAFFQTQHAFVLISGDLWKLIQGAAQGSLDISEVIGPVGIVGYVGEASQNGFGTVLLLAAMISVNLAIINLIPIPALDGGRLLVLLIETTIRRSAPRLVTHMFNALGIGLIVLLMLVVTYNDIGRLLA